MCSNDTQDENCNMLLTLGSYNIRAVNDAREYPSLYSGRRNPDDMFRRLERRLHEEEACRSQSVRIPANQDFITTAAVNLQPWKNSSEIT